MVRFNQNIPTLPLTKFRLTNTCYILLFIGLLLIRVFFNTVLPLMDQTEARYSEIARIMHETANWVVLQIDYGVPFWAKPPLSTWAGALSLTLFGISAFAVRLPYFLVCVIIALSIGRYQASKGHSFWLPGIILLTLPEFYLHAGVVSTDAFLLFSVIVVMLSFWEALQPDAKPFWGYLFFLGMGLGVLSKGPIIGIITLPPLLFWSWRTGNFLRALKTAPWLLGSLIFLLISIPWYVMAEHRSPGFIDYFIVGEHFNRYLNSEWKGDKYGFPKQQPFGVIWFFFVAFTFPWITAGIRLLFQTKLKGSFNPWNLYLLCWMLWPLLFFTSSKSLIHPYILPSLVPFALLIANAWDRLAYRMVYLAVAAGIPIVLFIVYLSGSVDSILKNNTDKYLIESAHNHALYSLNHKSYSSRFYSKGQIQEIDKEELIEQLEKTTPFWILIRNQERQSLSEKELDVLELADQNAKKGIYFFSGVEQGNGKNEKKTPKQFYNKINR